MSEMYRGMGSLKSKPKRQRDIIADILLEATGRAVSFDEIREKATGARYAETFKGETSINESIQYHLDAMVSKRTVAKV